MVAYALYAVAVTAVLLWYLFPATTVRQWLLFRLHRAVPALQCTIGELKLASPGRLVLRDVRLSSGQQAEKVLLTFGQVSLAPDGLAMLRERKVLGRLRLQLASGGIVSRLEPEGSGKLHLEGQVRGVRLEQLQGVQARLGRSFSGTLSGSFRGLLDLRDPRQSRIEANLVLEQGELTLKKPVLGLDRLPYGLIGSSVLLEKGRLRLDKGNVESRLLHGEFHGSVIPGRDMADSAILLKGVVRPRPELFARLGKGVSRMVRSQLRKGALDFSITGSLAEPGILFPALAEARRGEDR